MADVRTRQHDALAKMAFALAALAAQQMPATGVGPLDLARRRTLESFCYRLLRLVLDLLRHDSLTPFLVAGPFLNSKEPRRYLPR